MTEFQATALSVAKRVLGGSSIVLAVVYTIGHIFIAILCANSGSRLRKILRLVCSII